MALYDLLFSEVDGELLAENLETEITVESDIAKVTTIPQGFSGITPGSPVVMIKLKEAVPIAGFEYDFAQSMIDSKPFEFRGSLGGSGLSMTIPECWVIGPVTLSTSVGKATENDIMLVGKAPNPLWV